MRCVDASIGVVGKGGFSKATGSGEIVVEDDSETMGWVIASIGVYGKGGISKAKEEAAGWVSTMGVWGQILASIGVE